MTDKNPTVEELAALIERTLGIGNSRKARRAAHINQFMAMILIVLLGSCLGMVLAGILGVYVSYWLSVAVGFLVTGIGRAAKAAIGMSL